MKVLLTGAGGFLGGYLAKRLVRFGYDVSLLVRASSKIKFLERLVGHQNLHRFTNFSELSNILMGVRPDVLIHAACSYGRDGESFIDVIDSNINYGTYLLEACKTTPCSFINIGTPLPPDLNFYSLTKNQFSKIGEQIIANPCHQNFSFLNILLEHIYGIGENKASFIAGIIERCQRNEDKILLTKGEQQRDFLYIDDAEEAIIAILCNLHKFNGFQNIPIGSGISLSVMEAVKKIHRATSSSSELNFGALEYREKEVMYSAPDLSLIHSLGWVNKTSFDCGIEKIIEIRTNNIDPE